MTSNILPVHVDEHLFSLMTSLMMENVASVAIIIVVGNFEDYVK